MRNRNEVLSNEQIQQLAPSAFAGQCYEKQSDRYTFLPTSDVIDAMRQNGYQPTLAAQSRTHIAGKQMFTKHMLRFRQDSPMSHVGDSAMEMVLINSHDGTSAYKLMLGVFRMVCSNGLVVSESLVQSLRIRHTGNIINEVIEGTQKLIESAPLVQMTMEQWKRIELSGPEQTLFAQQAISLRFDESIPLDPNRVLQSRRPFDSGNDLWSVFNRVQESLIRGGNRYVQTVENNNGQVIGHRRNRTREVKGIDQNVNLNKALFGLAEGMAKLKS